MAWSGFLFYLVAIVWGGWLLVGLWQQSLLLEQFVGLFWWLCWLCRHLLLLGDLWEWLGQGRSDLDLGSHGDLDCLDNGLQGLWLCGSGQCWCHLRDLRQPRGVQRR